VLKLIGHGFEGITSAVAIIGQDGVKVWKPRQVAFEDWICFSTVQSETLNKGSLVISSDLGVRFLVMRRFGIYEEASYESRAKF